MLLAKQAGILAGISLIQTVIQEESDSMRLHAECHEGTTLENGRVIGVLTGPVRRILELERTLLNYLQRTSGIATRTRQFVEAVTGNGCRILDTRKTMPGLRYLDKWAVRIGGGENHRAGLYDMVLLKENHLRMAGGISAAVQAARAIHGTTLEIEVEVTSLAELEEALSLQVDRIMLDNFGLEQTRQAVARTASRVPLEASGNMTLERVADVAATGVDFISVGALTHSVAALDISLLFDA